MRALIALLPGDGIGPEVIDEGARLLRAVAERSRHEFQLEKGAIGGFDGRNYFLQGHAGKAAYPADRLADDTLKAIQRMTFPPCGVCASS